MRKDKNDKKIEGQGEYVLQSKGRMDYLSLGGPYKTYSGNIEKAKVFTGSVLIEMGYNWSLSYYAIKIA